MLVCIFAMYRWRVALNKGDEAKMDEKTNPANHIDSEGIRLRVNFLSSVFPSYCQSSCRGR